MRLKRRSRRVGRPELNLAAMIDVVFLLLIFFMCTSSFRPPEAMLPTQLPRTGAGADRPRDEFPPVRVHLEESEAGVLVRCDGQPCATFDELRDKLRARRAIADVAVIIDGQADVAFRHMVAALDACYAADLHRVAYAPIGERP